jgi:two-component system chemotaxis response regulator CheY
VPERRKKRVLVIDDAALMRLYYRHALQDAGFEVDEALNGLEALEKLLLAPADLLIVDVNMPTMDGFTFLQTLRHHVLPMGGTPALVTSTEARPQDFEAARAAGANFYLVKPVTREQLVAHAEALTGLRGG